MNMISPGGNGMMAFIPPLPPQPPEASITFQNHHDDSYLHHHHHRHTDLDFPTNVLMMRRSVSFSGMEWDHNNNNNQEGGVARGPGVGVGADDDTSDDGSSMQLGEKKRRLSLEQVKALEKSFELQGNKLEPERKVQLARALGLQPRQIAIWFQNRRARSKTKQLEKDYEVLKRQFEALSADNDALKSQNKKLHSELMALRNRESNGSGPTMIINLNNETEASYNNNNNINSENNNSISPTTNLTHLLHHHPSSRPNQDQTVQDHHHQGYCNMFGASIDDDEQAAAEFLAMAPATTSFPLNFSFS